MDWDKGVMAKVKLLPIVAGENWKSPLGKSWAEISTGTLVRLVEESCAPLVGCSKTTLKYNAKEEAVDGGIVMMIEASD